MRIEQLEYVAAVAKHGSLRRASEALHLSQPALSEAVSKLERELGLTLLDRRRSGARISREGQEMMQHLFGVLEAVERLRGAAGDHASRPLPVRLGTVNAATTTLVVPAIESLRLAEDAVIGRADLPGGVELVSMRQSEIDQALLEGGLDLGLVNVLDTDDAPGDLIDTPLLAGQPVVVLAAGHRLASRAQVSLGELREEPFVAMREGYLMHRFARRAFGGTLPRASHSADGAEMGKLLVADGLGVTLLPDYSVHGDPLERAGLIVTRPLRDETTRVQLVVRRRANLAVARPVLDLHAALVERAAALGAVSARDVRPVQATG